MYYLCYKGIKVLGEEVEHPVVPQPLHHVVVGVLQGSTHLEIDGWIDRQSTSSHGAFFLNVVIIIRQQTNGNQFNVFLINSALLNVGYILFVYITHCTFYMHVIKKYLNIIFLPVLHKYFFNVDYLFFPHQTLTLREQHVNSKIE